VEDQGFLDLLKDLLSDSNPMVSVLWCLAVSLMCYLHLFGRSTQDRVYLLQDGCCLINLVTMRTSIATGSSGFPESA